jgi:hypothetical protein
VQVCGNFLSSGNSHVIYAWQQYNAGSRDVEVTQWSGAYVGPRVGNPQMSMTLETNGKPVFSQSSPLWHGYQPYYSAGHNNTSNTGHSCVPYRAVASGSTIDFDLWVEADDDVRGRLASAHMWQILYPVR